MRTAGPGRPTGREEELAAFGYPEALSLLEAVIGQDLFDLPVRRRNVPGQQESDPATDDEQENDDEDFQRDVPSRLTAHEPRISRRACVACVLESDYGDDVAVYRRGRSASTTRDRAERSVPLTQ